MAFNNATYTLQAGAAISPHRALKFDSNGKAIHATAATDAVIGFSDYRGGASGDDIGVILPGNGVVRVCLKTAGSAGQRIVCSTDAGKVNADSWSAGDILLGILLKGGSAGDYVDALQTHAPAQAASA